MRPRVTLQQFYGEPRRWSLDDLIGLVAAAFVAFLLAGVCLGLAYGVQP